MEGWHIENFVEYIKFEKRYSAHTCVSYARDLAEFTSFLSSDFEITNPSDATSQQIRTWVFELGKQNAAASTIHRKISSVKSYYKYLLKNNIVKKSPLIGISLPKKAKMLPVFIDERKLNSIDRQRSGELPDFTLSLQRLVFEILYQTGMRRSELVNLEQKNIDLYAQQMKVLGKRNKERIIPFGEKLKTLLNDYIAQKQDLQLKSDFLLYKEDGKRVYDKWVYTVIKNELSSMTTLTKKSPHVLRHSFATHILNSGAEINSVKELLGHAGLAATQVYTHNTIEKLKKTYKKAHPRA